MGVDWEDFTEKIITYSPPKGRCKMLNFDSVTVIDDSYNANLESTIGALNYLKAFGTIGRNIFIFGDMLELGTNSEEHHKAVGRKCNDLEIDVVYLVGNYTKYTDMVLNSKISHQHFFSKVELVNEIKSSFNKNDVILIKGSRGMEMETIINNIF